MRILSVVLVAHLLCGSTLGQETITSEEFGFTFSVPDGFARQPKASEPNGLYLFRRDSESAKSGIAIERLHGLVNPEQRLTAEDEDMPVMPPNTKVLNVNVSAWSNVQIDVQTLELTLPNGRKVISQVAQFPLDREAVQAVVVIAPINQEPVDKTIERAKEVMASVIAGFHNTKPLYSPAKATSP